jgi:hypothetical protein
VGNGVDKLLGVQLFAAFWGEKKRGHCCKLIATIGIISKHF